MMKNKGRHETSSPARTSRDEMGILISDLVVRRGHRIVLPGIDLTVQPGELVGLLGPSGGGKSTLMRAIVGVQIVESGTVTIAGLPAGSPALRRRVGYVTQAPSVYADITVRENLAFFATLVGSDPARIDEVIDAVDLRAQADQLVGNLSGGQRSRVSLACALVGDPDVLILDEPTVGLDPVLRRDLWALFRAQAQAGRVVVVSSHVMDEATRCDRLLLLHHGRLHFDGSLPDLLAHTGAPDADAAFLALVDAAVATGSGDGGALTRHTGTSTPGGAS